MEEVELKIWNWGYDPDQLAYYTVVMWPEIQKYMDKPGFRENSYLINDEDGLEKFGSSAYVIDDDWMFSVDNPGIEL